MTEKRAENFNQIADSYDHNWSADRQRTRHPHERDLVAHAYTAADTFVETVKNLVLPACPDIRVEVCIGNGEKDYVPLRGMSAADIGRNLIKHETSAARKMRNDKKDVDNIDDPVRIRLVVPSGLSKREHAQSIEALRNLSRFLKETSHNGALLDGSEVTSYKDEHIRPSDEGFRSFKAHLSVVAPETFTMLDRVSTPSEITSFISTEEPGKKFDNPYVGESITGEVQIIHESMLDAERITSSVRGMERNILERSQSEMLYRTFSRASDITSFLNAGPMLRAIRTNINNHYAAEGGLNALVQPQFLKRVRVTPVTESISYYVEKMLGELTRSRPEAGAIISTFIPSTRGTGYRDNGSGVSAVIH